MRDEDIEKLLGGYATGTLTQEERDALFEAALADQTVFNALGNEQALKELLDDPHARRCLLTALQEKEDRQGIFSRLLEWRMRPAVVTVAGGMVVATLAVISVTRLLETLPPTQQTEEASRGRKAAAPSEQITAGKTIEPAPAKSSAKDQLVAMSKGDQEPDAKPSVAGRRTLEREVKPESRAMKDMPRPGMSPVPATPAPPPLAPADAPAPSEPGSVRDIFYGIVPARRQPVAADRPSGETAIGPEQGRRSSSAEPATEGSGRAFVDVQSAAKLEAPRRPTLQRLGVRYIVLQTEPGSFTLAVAVNQDAYLYVLTREASGAARLLFPTQTDAPQDARIEQDKQHLIPLTGRLLVEAEQTPRVIVVLARTPQSGLQSLPANALLSNELPSGRMLREEVIESRPGGANEKTVYVVEAVPSPSLSVEIPLPPRQ